MWLLEKYLPPGRLSLLVHPTQSFAITLHPILRALSALTGRDVLETEIGRTLFLCGSPM